MRILANFIMRGPVQAATVAVLGSVFPLMFWLSAATSALVTLRCGAAKGLMTTLWALLPALFWAWSGEPMGLFVIVMTFIMAVCLRQTVSWGFTLLAFIPVGTVMAWGVSAYYAPLMAHFTALLHQLYGADLSTLLPNGADISDQQLQAFVQVTMMKSISLVVSASSLLALVLARSWQSQLFNPGGLREEFYQLRFTPVTATMLIALSLLATVTQGDMAAAMEPVLIMPLLIAGGAMVHSLVWQKKLSSTWISIFYVVLFTAYPAVVLLACLDSLLNFRARLGNRVSD